MILVWFQLFFSIYLSSVLLKHFHTIQGLTLTFLGWDPEGLQACKIGGSAIKFWGPWTVLPFYFNFMLI